MCRAVMAGPCAIGAREPGQGREAAAFSGTSDVLQVAWPSPAGTRPLRATRAAAPVAVRPAAWVVAPLLVVGAGR